MEVRIPDPLNPSIITARLGTEARACLRKLTVLDNTDSTNACLARLPAADRHAHAVLADAQSAGRGRRQRSWHSPPGGNLYLSLGWRFESAGVSLSTLPLATAVCLCRMLDRCGLQTHGIKWPNDILIDGRKLAGILVESQSVPGQGSVAVIGIGLNVRMPGSAAEHIDRPFTDLASWLPTGGDSLERNTLAARLLDSLLPALTVFSKSGFEPFRGEWGRWDLLTGRRVALEGNGMARAGKVLGIDDDGGLAVDVDDFGPQVLHAADVSLLDA